MQQQDLIILQVLKIPVVIIKFIAKIIAIATYLPNYLFLYVVDTILFNEKLQATLKLYILTWIPKFTLLILAGAFFIAQFYLIFLLLKIQDYGLIIRTIVIIMTLAGLFILMRKGYLSMIQKYQLKKLYSFKQHLQKFGIFTIDLFAISLTITNTLLIINIPKTFSYAYEPKTNYQFVKHITKLIRESLIFYIQSFYIAFFFKLFPWRLNKTKQIYQQQKNKVNVLNCLVLLSLTFCNTNLDIVIFLVFGGPNLLYFKRNSYILKLKATEVKWKITLEHFIFILLHFIQLAIEVCCLVFCWQNGKRALLKLLQYDKISQLFKTEFGELVIQTCLKIPYVFANSILFLSIYKYKKRNLQEKKMKRNGEQEQEQETDRNRQRSYLYILLTFTLLLQLFLQLMVLPLIVVNTILKPWNYWWVTYIIEQPYTFNLLLIVKYFLKNIGQIICLPQATILTCFVSLIDIQKIIKIYNQALITLNQKYQKEVTEQYTRKKKASALALDSQKLILCRGNLIYNYSRLLFVGLYEDLPYLPAYLFIHCNFMILYKSEFVPRQSALLAKQLIKQYYFLRLSKSERFTYYFQMNTSMKASGNLQTLQSQILFWKYAYRCEVIRTVQKVVAFLLPQRSIDKIKSNLTKGSNFSDLSSEYWYLRDLLMCFIKKLVFIVLQALLTLIGLVFMVPLTLWRLPTFIILYRFHKDKYMFFSILFPVYRQMLIDIFALPLKVIVLIVSPLSYIKYIYHTSFQYGPQGTYTLAQVQALKRQFLIKHILLVRIKQIIFFWMILCIYLFWIRKKQLRYKLRKQKMTVFATLFQISFKTRLYISIESILNNQILQVNNPKSSIYYQIVGQSFVQAVNDLPYLLLTLLILLTMPWRINYIIQTLYDIRDNKNERRAFLKLLKNALKDYACIFMNLLLFLSVFKTKKALILFKKNYKLNFFIGFLEFSYYWQLINQIKHLARIYLHFLYFIVACLFGWTRADLMINQLKQLRKVHSLQRENYANNKKIYENTVKTGKQLQTLNKMGYYNYINVCSFLKIDEIIMLRRVDKFNYMMTKRQQIWFMKWQQLYSGTSLQIQSDYELRCKNEFIKNQHHQSSVNNYQSIIMKHFINNVCEQEIDLKHFLRSKLNHLQFQSIFINYSYRIHEGYGPQSQLPQQQNEDPQYLRLTMQVRRLKVELTQNEFWLHFLYIKSNQLVFRKVFRLFNQNINRKRKQVYFMLTILCFFIMYMLAWWSIKDDIFILDSLIGVKILYFGYIHSYLYLTILRLRFAYHTWTVLHPFDIKEDFIKFLSYTKQLLQSKIYSPLANLCNKLKDQITKIGNKLIDKTLKVSIMTYEKIIKPLYVSIADKIRAVSSFITRSCFGLIRFIRATTDFILGTGKSIVGLLRIVFSNLNKAYYLTLQKSSLFFLGFGLLGNIAFSLFGLLLMACPSIVCWFLYSERWYVIVSTIHTMVLVVTGYKHLLKIRARTIKNKEQ